MLKLAEPLAQKLVPPVIVPGCKGRAVPFTASDLEGELPHTLLAVTVIVPVPLPAVVLMLLVVEVPDQPKGRFHK
jgi:hypothetical protein